MNSEDFILPTDINASEMIKKEARIVDDWLRKEILKIFPNESFKDLNALRDLLAEQHFVLTVQENLETNDYTYALFRNQEYISMIILRRSFLVEL